MPRPSFAVRRVALFASLVPLALQPRPSTAAETATDRVVVEGLGALDVRLSPASVVTDRTRFVVGPDRAHDWDRQRVRARRGEVPGEPGSHVFFVESAAGRSGYLDRNGDRHWISDRAVAERPKAHAGLSPDARLCGCGEPARRAAPPIGTERLLGVPETTRVVELAVETDHELFSLIGDVDGTIDYIVELYSAVSDIFERDLAVRLELTYVRVWDTPDDLFNQPEPLQPFRQYWNQNMADVDRDVAQLLSGRRDLPWGGIAYLSALCGDRGYSVVGYALGFVPDLDAPSIYHYDVVVCAHELGHNLGANHTHSYGLDDCFNLSAPPQRGTIMSYCSQSVSGGNAVSDLRFHTYVQARVREYLASIACDHRDCDGDGVDDAEEIANGAEADSNLNGVPDSCEDCDGDGVLDDAEIAAGAPDLDGNLVPDECEADCNSNGVPDALDIALGTSLDLHADGVPDECEADCDGDGVSDYTQLMANMSLDLDRNRILDSCEDCDGDGTMDLEALDGALDAWVATHDPDQPLHRVHAVVGTRVTGSQEGEVAEINDLLVVADGTFVVSCGERDRVARFDRRGHFLGDLAAAGTGGLVEPTGMAVGPSDGLLYVASRGSNAVLRFDLAQGALVDAFVASGGGGLVTPFGLAFGPDGSLFVSGDDGQIRRYGIDGRFLGIFVAASANGGLVSPRGMLFMPDGNLIVASLGTNELLEYDGSTGAFLGKFNRGGTSTALTLDEPWGLRLGPNGNLFVARHHVDPGGTGGGLFDGDIAELHVNSSRLYEFDAESGNFIRSYVTGHDTGIWQPTAFDFLPAEGLDCNGNRVPDACDILSGRSADLDGDGVPDECGRGGHAPEDLDHDGFIGGSDLALLLANWLGRGVGDIDESGSVDGGDLARLLSAWAAP